MIYEHIQTLANQIRNEIDSFQLDASHKEELQGMIEDLRTAYVVARKLKIMS